MSRQRYAKRYVTWVRYPASTNVIRLFPKCWGSPLTKWFITDTRINRADIFVQIFSRVASCQLLGRSFDTSRRSTWSSIRVDRFVDGFARSSNICSMPSPFFKLIALNFDSIVQYVTVYFAVCVGLFGYMTLHSNSHVGMTWT